MDKPIRVRVMGREYALRVREEDEDLTQEIANYLDVRMRAFRDAHPEQLELTTAVVTALAVTEELFMMRRQAGTESDEFHDEIKELTSILENALRPPNASSDRADN